MEITQPMEGRPIGTGETPVRDLENEAVLMNRELADVSKTKTETQRKLHETYAVLTQLHSMGMTDPAFKDAYAKIQSSYEVMLAEYQRLQEAYDETSAEFAHVQAERAERRISELRGELAGHERNREYVTSQMADLKAQEQALGAFTEPWNKNQEEQRRMRDLNLTTLADIETIERQIQQIEDVQANLDASSRSAANPEDLH